jgi:hypothetical protein
MADGRSWAVGGWLAFALGLMAAAIAAEGDRLHATLEQPAVVTLEPAPGVDSRASAPSGRAVLSITQFKPPSDGSAVQVVVKLQKPDGTEQEVHRFGVFPQREVTAGEAPRKFGFALPKDLASSTGPVKFKVELVPLRGSGEGARIELGGVQREAAR